MFAEAINSAVEKERERDGEQSALQFCSRSVAEWPAATTAAPAKLGGGQITTKQGSSVHSGRLPSRHWQQPKHHQHRQDGFHSLGWSRECSSPAKLECSDRTVVQCKLVVGVLANSAHIRIRLLRLITLIRRIGLCLPQLPLLNFCRFQSERQEKFNINSRKHTIGRNATCTHTHTTVQQANRRPLVV